jgi:hypothetical protein
MLHEAVEPRAVYKVVRSCSLLCYFSYGIAETIICCLLAKTRFSSRLLRHRNHPNEFAKAGVSAPLLHLPGSQVSEWSPNV